MSHPAAESHTTADSHTVRYLLTLGERGRIVLPAPVRERLGVGVGDQLVLALEEDGTLRLAPVRAQVQRVEGIYRHLAPEGGVVDQLIEDRRAEVRQEQAGGAAARRRARRRA